MERSLSDIQPSQVGRGGFSTSARHAAEPLSSCHLGNSAKRSIKRGIERGIKRGNRPRQQHRSIVAGDLGHRSSARPAVGDRARGVKSSARALPPRSVKRLKSPADLCIEMAGQRGRARLPQSLRPRGDHVWCKLRHVSPPVCRGAARRERHADASGRILRRGAASSANMASVSVGKPAMRSAPNTSPAAAARGRAEIDRVGAIVAALHALENEVVARLQGQMQMRHQPRSLRNGVEQIASASIQSIDESRSRGRLGHCLEDRLRPAGRASGRPAGRGHRT